MALATLTQLGEFETVIDVRSPSEFADDHLPGAINCPVLDDAERAEVGTMYRQVSPFAARRRGAVLVARNIAEHIEQHFADRPRDWHPLVYCWRGGQRSGAFTHVLREIGWRAHRLDGGYKAWRRHVIEQLDGLPAQYRFVVVSGPTGSGKSRLLDALSARGEQVLHLEHLAAHKGSVLGALPDQPQPSQRQFESLLFARLSTFDATRPVYVEAESRKIGKLHVPGHLIERMRAAPTVAIDAPVDERARFLQTDYAYALADTPWLKACLAQLRALQGRDVIERWQALTDAGDFATLTRELLERHYDPLYRRSQGAHYATGASTPLATARLDDKGIDVLADALLRRIATTVV